MEFRKTFSMKIVKNFMDEKNFEALEKVFFQPLNYFPWFLSQGINKISSSGGDGFSQLTHTFYQSSMTPNINSQYYDLMIPILNFLKPKQVHRIKGNVLFKTHVPVEHGYHIDYSDCTTSILYINTNNGYTKFKESQEKVQSERNKMVSFDSNLEHTGATCTDKNYKMVINFNYTL